jgi:hypothetical protein
VHNAWGGVNGLYFSSSPSVVVWVCDNRSASGKDAESAWVAYSASAKRNLDLECLAT